MHVGQQNIDSRISRWTRTARAAGCLGRVTEKISHDDRKGLEDDRGARALTTLHNLLANGGAVPVYAERCEHSTSIHEDKRSTEM